MLFSLEVANFDIPRPLALNTEGTCGMYNSYVKKLKLYLHICGNHN